MGPKNNKKNKKGGHKENTSNTEERDQEIDEGQTQNEEEVKVEDDQQSEQKNQQKQENTQEEVNEDDSQQKQQEAMKEDEVKNQHVDTGKEKSKQDEKEETSQKEEQQEEPQKVNAKESQENQANAQPDQESSQKEESKTVPEVEQAFEDDKNEQEDAKQNQSEENTKQDKDVAPEEEEKTEMKMSLEVKENATESKQDEQKSFQQTDVIEDYPTDSKEEKKKVPYIEKQNGNIYAKKDDYERAIVHYNKSLFALKMIFESDQGLISDQETAIRYIKEIEIPVALNLGLSYLKTEQFHYAIKYCSQVLEREEENDKALYRRGMAYLGIGELNKAKSDLMKAYNITEGKDTGVIKGLEKLKEKQEQHKQQEIDMSKKMIGGGNKKRANGSQSSTIENTGEGEEQGKGKSYQLAEKKESNKKVEELDSFFGSFLKLIKAILMMPYYIYMNLMEKVVKFFFKIVFLFVKIAEQIPIVGPKAVWVMKQIPGFDFQNAGDLKGKTIFISGASRGIGLAIALRAAQDGANIVIAAKTVTPHPKLEGTIHTAANDIIKAGGKCLAIQCDIRDEAQVIAAVEKAVQTFGGIDILINNASAIYQSSLETTATKQFDLAMNINTRGTFLCSKHCIPHLRKSKNPHILTLSPPLYMATDTTNWFGRVGTGYVLAKYGMTLITHGLADELKDDKIACNTLWPRTSIATAAVKNLLGGDTTMNASRTPEIMADSAYVIITSNSVTTTDNFFIDDEVLASTGVQDFTNSSNFPQQHDNINRINRRLYDSQYNDEDFSQQQQQYVDYYQAGCSINSGMLRNSQSNAYSQLQQMQTQRQQENQKINSVFFENSSKYISLKRYRLSNNFAINTETTGKESKTQLSKPSIFGNQEQKSGLTITKWLESLSNPEKNLVLTIVDQKLVKLVKVMYRYYSNFGNGKFYNTEYHSDQAKEIVRVREYDNQKNETGTNNFMFLKPNIKKGKNTSQVLANVENAENAIVNAVRIISVNTQDDAITLSHDFYSNSSFFLNMLKIATNSQFLFRELELVRDSSRLANSLWCPQGNAKESQKQYFSFKPMRDWLIREYTLGQCLCHIIEKAINVQFYDYQSKLTTTHQFFFFLQEQPNIFHNDNKLSQYWMGLSQDKRNSLFNLMNEIEAQLLKEKHLKTQKVIKEENSGSDDDDYYDRRGRNSDPEDFDLEEQRFRHFRNDDDDEDNEDEDPSQEYLRTYQHQLQLTSEQKSGFNYGNLTMSRYIKEKNHLFSSNQNILMKLKTTLIACGREADSEEQAFKFIKLISQPMTLYQCDSTKTSVEFLKQFNEKLSQHQGQSIIDELMDYEDKKPSKGASNQAHNQNQSNSQGQGQKKKNKKKKKKNNKNADAKVEEQKSSVEVVEPQKDKQEVSIEHNLKQEVHDMTRRLEERRGLLSNEILFDKYPQEEYNNSSINNTIQLEYEFEQLEEQKLKKQLKNKNNKNKKKLKNKKQQQQNQQDKLQQQMTYEPIEIEMQELNKKQEETPVKISIKGHVSDDVYDIESIELEQIDLVIPDDIQKELSDESQSKPNFSYALEIAEDDIEVGEYGFYQEQKLRSNSGKSVADEVERLKEEDEEEAAQKIAQIVAAELCQKAIFSVSQQGPDTNPKKEDTHTKKKKNKKNKKSQHVNKFQTQELSNLEEVQADIQTQDVGQIKDEDNQNECKKQQQQKHQHQQRQQQKVKRVGFKIGNDERISEEEINVPKRGSSRGSSGTEEVRHQQTMNMLGELFPSDYKNPSDDTKIIISEITKDKSLSPEPEQRYTIYRPKHQDAYQVRNNYNQAPTHQKKKPRKQTNDEPKSNLQPQPLQKQDTKSNEGDKQSKPSQQRKVKSQKVVLTATDTYQTMFQKTFGTSETNEEMIKQEVTKMSSAAAKEIKSSNAVQQVQKKVKRDDLQERGVSVNPDNIQSANKKQAQEAAVQNNSKKYKKKTKILVQQQKPIVEQRSQTPNVDHLILNFEPLTTHQHKSKNANHNKQKKAKYGQNPMTNLTQEMEQLLAFNQQTTQHMQNQPYVHQNVQTSPELQGSTQFPYAYNFFMPQLFMNPHAPGYGYPSQQVQYNFQMPNQQQYQGYHQQEQSQQPPQQQEESKQDVDPIGSSSQTPPPQLHVNHFQNINIQVHLSSQLQHFPQYYNPNFMMPMNFQQQIPQTMSPQSQPFVSQSPPLMMNSNQFMPNLASSPNKGNFQPQYTNEGFQYLPPSQQSHQQNNYQSQSSQPPHKSQSQNHHHPHQQQQQHSSHKQYQRKEKHSSSNKHEVKHQQQMQGPEDRFNIQLDREIFEVAQRIKTKIKQTEWLRQQAFNLLSQLIKDAYQGKSFSFQSSLDCHISVEIYGSMATGLAIDSSDMDVLVQGVFMNDTPDRYQLIAQMSKLHKQLNNLSSLESNSMIETATVPVIKIVLDLQKIAETTPNYSKQNEIVDISLKHLKIDITFDDRGNEQYMSYGIAQPIHMGIKCAEFIKTQLQMNPLLEPLTLVLKKFLAVLDLNSPFLGGLSSYGLILMIIAAFNQYSNISAYGQLDFSMSKLLSYFLFFYGKLFDPTMFIINEHMTIFQQYNFTSSLTILDPLNPMNNIGKSTYNFDQIKQNFSDAYDRLSQAQQKEYDGNFYNVGQDQQPSSQQLLSIILNIPLDNNDKAPTTQE